MDISVTFKACLKSRKTNNYVELPYNAKSILDTKKCTSVFHTKIREISSHIKQLYTILQKNRLLYLELNKHDSNHNVQSINSDESDSIAKNIINTNFQVLKKLRDEVYRSSLTTQNKEHQKIVVAAIENYLKHTYEIFTELQSLRLKKPKSLRSFYKLNQSLAPSNSVNIQSVEDRQVSVPKVNDNIDESSNPEHEVLSSEDIQMFKDENEHIYSEFNVLGEEIEQIENKVVRIHELQEIFMEKVITQDKNLENLLTNVVGSTQNVREANEQIRKAIQSNAGLRVWILFFLLIMSFTLLFLDWYNP